MFYAGMRVVIDSPKFCGQATIKKVLQKNVDIVMDDGRAVRSHPSFLTAIAGDAGQAQFAPLPVPDYVPAPQPGTVVTVADDLVLRQPQLQGLWIVCGGQGDKSRLFRLNNTDGRYWRIPNSKLTKVDANLVLPAPAGV